MANEEHINILRQGAEVWNRWRKENSRMFVHYGGVKLHGADLSGSNLAGVNLSESDFYNANFSFANLEEADFYRALLVQANFSEADLRNAHFYRADLQAAILRGANLTRADLSCTNLSEADLEGAVLSEANLGVSNFNGAKLHGADFTKAVTGWSTFSNVDLSNVKGLDTMHHKGPSSVGTDTIYRSNGVLPLAFLRGCGLSDIQIEMVNLHQPDLSVEHINDILYRIHDLRVGDAIQYHSSFISYAHQDQAFADVLHHDLQESGIRCWYAPYDLPIGARIRTGIDEAIRTHDILLLILSEYSVTSNWVEKEVEAAFEKEREYGEPVLLPIQLDDSVMKIKTGWPADIRRARHIGDFRQWKNYDEYQKAFERLLRDLKAASANG